MNIFLRQKFRQIANLSTNKWNRWKKTQKFANFYKKYLPVMAFCGISFYFLKKKMQQKFKPIQNKGDKPNGITNN